eukprot:snap_masked-scaffold_2-processed-gene-16.19-mRNA-1 protein AED:1.00 eAED:1.00 QI:0/0/0/0/1/1/3/0/211
MYPTKISSSKMSPNDPRRISLEDIIKPIENAALVLIFSAIGITVANIYFGVNYTSTMDRLSARKGNLSKSFEIFNDICLISGMVCIFVYLVWSNGEAKGLLYEEVSSDEFRTTEASNSLFIRNKSTNPPSFRAASAQKEVLSKSSLPQFIGRSFYSRFRRASNIEVSHINQTNLDTTGSKFRTVSLQSFTPANAAGTVVSQPKVPANPVTP